jgi:hypothetical protein
MAEGINDDSWAALTAALSQALEVVVATEQGVAALDTGNYATLDQLEEDVNNAHRG